jgi:N-acylneuraminate cytidylyltransferase
MDQKIIAIIPARGGSKGLPRKNVLPLDGKPLISYCITAAKASSLIENVFVTTDDAEIAEISKLYGAQVIQRPLEISGDTASSESALLHALDYLEKVKSYRPEILVFLQCTSPLTLPEDIDHTIKVLLSEKADSALTVSRTYSFLWGKNEHGESIAINHNKMKRLLRQQREPQYVETGAVYVMQVAGFLEEKHRFFGKTVMHVVPQERSLEIDDPVDFEIIESMMKARSCTSIDLRERARKIKLVVCDVDGVLTDGGMYYTETGDELKKFNTRDGIGMEYLREAGMLIAFMTREKTNLVLRRGKKLMVDFVKQGVMDKGNCIDEFVKEVGVSFDQICFIGDDIHDIPALRKVGLSCCPADACETVRQVCHHSLDARGGQGCIRELAETILKFKGNSSI